MASTNNNWASDASLVVLPIVFEFPTSSDIVELLTIRKHLSLSVCNLGIHPISYQLWKGSLHSGHSVKQSCFCPFLVKGRALGMLGKSMVSNVARPLKLENTAKGPLWRRFGLSYTATYVAIL